MKGEPVSNGIAMGQAFLIVSEAQVAHETVADDQLEHEVFRFRKGRDAAAAELETLIEKVRAEMGNDKAEIFEGHLEMLTSEDIDEEVVALIQEKKLCAEAAAQQVAETNAKEMEELDDPYFQERGQDFRDIGRQLIQGISGRAGSRKELPENAIVISDELAPSQTASLDMSKVSGFIVRTGGVNSHAAIIARSLELPAVIMREADFFNLVQDGDPVAMDGSTGELWIRPEAEVSERLTRKDVENKKNRAELLKLLDLPSVTLDGRKVGLYGNVGGAHDIQSAKRYKADGIGLFRTEFLFMESMSSPTLARQTEVYRSAIEAMDGQPVIIRLLDTGADKPLPYWSLPPEDNPFLGMRGIRLLFEKEDILRTQIQALLKASEAGPVGMMIPMIASLGPIHRVKALLEEEKAALNWTGPDNLMVGVMIETPAAVQMIKEILDIVDFISIGTNDLTQYMLAADRGNPSVHAYYDEFHPAVLRAIAHVIRQAGKKGKLNGICGELAGNPLAAPFFVGLGVDELSSNPPQIAELKQLIRRMNASEAEELVEEILRLPTSEGIQARLTRFLKESILSR